MENKIVGPLLPHPFFEHDCLNLCNRQSGCGYSCSACCVYDCGGRRGLRRDLGEIKMTARTLHNNDGEFLFNFIDVFFHIFDVTREVAPNVFSLLLRGIELFRGPHLVFVFFLLNWRSHHYAESQKQVGLMRLLALVLGVSSPELDDSETASRQRFPDLEGVNGVS